MLRTRTCGEIRATDVGETATLCGWVDGYRDHGGLVFIDLRDRYGITQIVFHLEEGSEMHEQARSLRNEDVIQATGEVRHRGAEMVNPKLPTGEIEIRSSEVKLLNKILT
ncbi:MAG: aspartate--tRNA ligase, partial [Planctomycetaceae bacterium]|nr:aspartate--tRNA ligase [Planctomycetaceae bacterium]